MFTQWTMSALFLACGKSPALYKWGPQLLSRTCKHKEKKLRKAEGKSIQREWAHDNFMLLYSVVKKNFEGYICNLFAWPWAKYSTSVYLSFCIYNVGSSNYLYPTMLFWGWMSGNVVKAFYKLWSSKHMLCQILLFVHLFFKKENNY